MGELPDWYQVLTTARYYTQPPWVLAGIPDTADAYCWVQWAQDLQWAEHRASQRKQS